MVFKRLGLPFIEIVIILTFVGVIILLSLAFRERPPVADDGALFGRGKIVRIVGDQAHVEGKDWTAIAKIPDFLKADVKVGIDCVLRQTEEEIVIHHLPVMKELP